MQKNILIGLGALVLVVGLGMYFVLSGPGDNSGLLSKTLNKNYKGGLKCVQHVAMAGLGSMTNTIYMDSQGKRIRFESLSSYNEGMKRETYMIDDGEKTYLWGSGMRFPGTDGPSGMIMDSNAEDNPKEDMPIDLEELRKNDFKAPGVECSPWAVDESMFTPPAEVQFKNMSDFLGAPATSFEGMGQEMNSAIEAATQSAKGANAGTTSMNCDEICAVIPDNAARNECLQSCKGAE